MKLWKVATIAAVAVGIFLFSRGAWAKESKKSSAKLAKPPFHPADLDGIPLDGRRLSDSEVAYVAAWAGWEGEDLKTAVRIIFGESNGNPMAVNVNRSAKGKYKDSVDRGLWQFNNVAFPELSIEDAHDVMASTRKAYKVWQKVGWHPWSAGKTETHTRHKVGGNWVRDDELMNRAEEAVKTLEAWS